MKRFIAALSLSGLALTAPASSASLDVGRAAPDVTLEGIDDSKVSLSELRGKVVVLTYWATWCAPCRAELPLLDTYYDMQKSHGLRVFAAATEDSLPVYRMRKIFAAMHLTPVKRLKAPYNVHNAVPMNYVIDRAGRIRYAKAGSFDLETLNDVLVPLLKEPVPTT